LTEKKNKVATCKTMTGLPSPKVFNTLHNIISGPGSSVSIATAYGLDGPGTGANLDLGRVGSFLGR